MNRKDLQASTLVRLIRENPVLDPLAVQHLKNGYTFLNHHLFHQTYKFNMAKYHFQENTGPFKARL